MECTPFESFAGPACFRFCLIFVFQVKVLDELSVSHVAVMDYHDGTIVLASAGMQFAIVAIKCLKK